MIDSFALIYFIILIIAVVVHEISHGYAALFLGDTTARDAGRLSINPIRHVDIVGSIIVPLISTFLHVPFGWAKPVPVDISRLRNRRWGEAIVALAGPASNIALALLFGLIFRLTATASSIDTTPEYVLLLIITINIGLAVFNLLPIPPFDGSKILFALIPRRFVMIRAVLETYQLGLVILVLIFAPQIMIPLLEWSLRLITGITLQF